MKTGAAITVGVVGLVAAAAVVSGIRSAIDGDAHGGTPDVAGATAVAATVETNAAAPAAASTTPAVPVGDIRRLPKLRPGAFRGMLMVYSAGLCLPTIVDLRRAGTTSNSQISVCNEWASPAGRRVALTLAPPEDGELRVAKPVQPSRPDDTGLPYVPGRAGLVTVTDDGTVATCDGRRVLVSRRGHVRTVRTFTPVSGGSDERCVTGAIGVEVVQLAGDRRRLVDAVTGATVRRLAVPVRRPLAAIVASSDGDVLIADAAGGALEGTVYAPDGAVLVSRRRLGRAGTVRKAELTRGGTVVAVQTASGWDITDLAGGRTVTITPGGAQVVDVAIAPDGRAAAAATVNGVVLLSLPDLVPRALIPEPAQGVGWYPAALLPHLREAPVRSAGEAPVAAAS